MRIIRNEENTERLIKASLEYKQQELDTQHPSSKTHCRKISTLGPSNMDRLNQRISKQYVNRNIHRRKIVSNPTTRTWRLTHGEVPTNIQKEIQETRATKHMQSMAERDNTLR